MNPGSKDLEELRTLVTSSILSFASAYLFLYQHRLILLGEAGNEVGLIEEIVEDAREQAEFFETTFSIIESILIANPFEPEDDEGVIRLKSLFDNTFDAIQPAFIGLAIGETNHLFDPEDLFNLFSTKNFKQLISRYYTEEPAEPKEILDFVNWLNNSSPDEKHFPKWRAVPEWDTIEFFRG